jgi:hypothetical protein
MVDKCGCGATCQDIGGDRCRYIPPGVGGDLAKKLEGMFMQAMMGGPQPKRPQTALRVRGNGFEVVELDDAGNIVEPPPRCCYGTVLHAPNCKTWGSLT